MVLGLGGNEGVSIVITAVDNFSKTFGVAQSQLNAFKPAGLAIAAGFAAVGVGLAGIATVAVKTAMDFESAFAGVRKTVDLTAEEFKVLDKNLQDMTKTVPKSYVELASIAEIAGQLGVTGVDNITQFTKTITDISETTNLTAEQAATDFARFANIMNMPISSVDRLGSTVVDLGNNLATTEAEIVDMSMRIAGAGSTLGMTEGQVMGWGAALSSMGIRAEMGGTAISKLMIEISSLVSTGSEDLVGFADTAGMTTEEFSKLFKEDASAALQAFFNGLGNIKEEGGDVLVTLEELNITEVRLRDAVLRLTSGSDTLNKSLDIQKTAWTENTALSEEAQKRYETLESQIQMVKNQLTLMAKDIGEKLMPIIRDTLLPFLRDKLIPTMGKIFDKIVPIIKNEVVPLIENTLIPAVNKLIDFTRWLKDSWTDLSPEMKTAIKIGALATVGVLALAAAAAVLSIILGVLLSPLILIALGIGAVVAAGYYLWQNWAKIGVAINNIFIKIGNTVIDIWNGIINTIASSINKIIGYINSLLKGLNKISSYTGIEFGQLGYVDLSRFKPEQMLYERYVPPTEQPKAQNITNINIDNLNGFNARDIAEQLQTELENKISLG